MSQKRDQKSLFEPVKPLPYWPFDLLYSILILWDLVLIGLGLAAQHWGSVLFQSFMTLFVAGLWYWSRATHFKRVRYIAEMQENMRITKAQMIMHYQRLCQLYGEEGAYHVYASRFNEATLRDLGITTSHTNQD